MNIYVFSQGGLKLTKETRFDSQYWSSQTDFGNINGPRGPVLASFSAKIVLAGPILGETGFGMICSLENL